MRKGQTVAPGVVAVGLSVCLDSGLEGIIQAPYLTDDQTGQIHVDNYVRKGQTVALGIVTVSLSVHLDSGLEGVIQAPYLTDDQMGQICVDNYVMKGQTRDCCCRSWHTP